MTVMETVLAAAVELGIEKRVREYFEAFSSEGKEDAEALVRCVNLVENELALDYLPLLAEDTILTDTGVVFFSDLKRKAARILKVTDEYGASVPFTIFPEYLKAQAGKITVRYAYSPEVKTENDESDYITGASVRLFAYGIAAEYLLASGAFEESAVWDKKYKEAIAAAYRSKPSAVIASRRWV